MAKELEKANTWYVALYLSYVNPKYNSHDSLTPPPKKGQH